MNTPRPHIAWEIPLPLAAALTTWLSLFAWSGFVMNPGVFVGPALLGVVTVATVGVVARLVRLPRVIVVVTQLLTVMLFTNASWGSSALPTPASIEATVGAFRESVEALGTYAAPVPSSVGEVAPALVLASLVCHLLVDVCAVTLQRVPIAGLPLLVVYTVPVGILDRSVNPLVFSITVIGFLVMLALQEGQRVARWGRRFGAPPGADGPGVFGATDARRHPAAIGAVAIVLALGVPIVVPSLDLNPFGGDGSGPGSGDREVRITNPMTDLHRDLVRGEDIPLLTVEVPGGAAPSYLRTTVLTTYTGEAWTPGDRDLPSRNSVDNDLPSPLPRDLAQEQRRWDVQVSDDLDSLWLPTPVYTASISGAREWRFDRDTLDIHAARDEMSTRGMDYALEEIVADIPTERLAEAGPPRGDLGGSYRSLPGNLPDRVEELTAEVTGDAENDLERAVALQRWFREGDRFTYSTDRAPGNGNNALLEFLDESRTGYCEQFASAMAVMARQAGIPARVAVGFFRADRVGPGRYEFSTHDLHAWPELYFEGTGWVLFDPTPSTHIPDVPSYSEQQGTPDGPDANESAGPTQSASPSPSRTMAPSESAAPESDQQADGAGEEGGIGWAPFVWGGAGLVLVVLLALVPRSVRSARRRRRWHEPDQPIEAAWAELADSASDLRVPWPSGRSPRETGRALTHHFAAPPSGDTPERPVTGPETNPAAVRSLQALVQALEETRYSPTPGGVSIEQLHEDVAACVDAWRGGVTPRARFWATWLPKSVLTPASARSARPEPTNSITRDADPVDHID